MGVLNDLGRLLGESVKTPNGLGTLIAVNTYSSANGYDDETVTVDVWYPNHEWFRATWLGTDVLKWNAQPDAIIEPIDLDVDTERLDKPEP